jgi:hypothetical protein
MDVRFAHIARCLDVQERDLAEAVATRAATKALLAHMAEICAPNTGAAKVLLVFSRMATTACGWIDGDLCVDLVADADQTVIEASTELGGGLRERILAPMAFRAPIHEFVRAIERVPHVIAPLAIRAKSPERASLSATEASRRTTAPPPPIEISADSFFAHPSKPAAAHDAAVHTIPPDDIDAGWEEEPELER